GNSTKGIPYFYLYHMHRNRFIFAVKNYDTKYLLKFFKIYTRDSMAGLYHWTRGSKDINHQAQYKAYFWNVSHFFHNFGKRKDIKKLGPKFNELLLNDSAEYVSIVIPCYNYADYVGEAIESALAQTQAPLEIIVINDGSTDHSLDVIKEYKDKVTIIDNENMGVIKTKNLGIEKARGEWIIFLDADDKLDPTYIEKTLRLARANNKDIVYTDMMYFGAKNKVFKARPYSFGSLLDGNYINNSALHKKSFLQRVGGYKQEMKDGYEDWELNISMAEKKAKFGYLPKPLMFYRQHSESSQRNDIAINKAPEIIKTVKKLHAKSYSINAFKVYKIVALIKKIIRDPVLGLFIIITLPLAIIKAWVLFPLKLLKHEWADLVKKYIHRKPTA
ncbi:MAG: glycosyltransferase, partial [Patescibacteria group bacterium]